MDLRKLKTLIELWKVRALPNWRSVRARTRPHHSHRRSVSQAYAPAPQQPIICSSTASRSTVAEPAKPAAPEGHVGEIPDGRYVLPLGIARFQAFRGRRPKREQRDTLCIIEAMKLLNEIDADQAGSSRRFWSKTANRWSLVNLYLS